MKEIPISDFKANCAALLKRVQITKKPIRVTRFGKRIVEIGPVSPKPTSASWVGSMKGEIKLLGDIISPANDEDEWDALR